MDLPNLFIRFTSLGDKLATMLIKSRARLSRVFAKLLTHLGATLDVPFLTSFLHKANWLSMEYNYSSRNFEIMKKMLARFTCQRLQRDPNQQSIMSKCVESKPIKCDRTRTGWLAVERREKRLKFL